MLGFRVLLEALEQGYRVRAALRNREGFEKIKSSSFVAPYQAQLESVIVLDIAADGAYDEAVKGVNCILHIASPTPRPTMTDFEKDIMAPAVRGTVGLLESAMKSPTVRRVVITASIGAIVPGEKLMTGDDSVIYNGKIHFMAFKLLLQDTNNSTSREHYQFHSSKNVSERLPSLLGVESPCLSSRY
jgi:nucleoside-diphosphate-sugar epimerase